MRLTAIIFVLLTAASALAQDFEIFDPSDFIDPRERGAVFDATGSSLTNPGRSFSVARFYGGAVHDYQLRDTPSKANVDFSHVTFNHYRGTQQYTLKFTGYHTDSGIALPQWRGTFQFGKYVAIPANHESAGAEDEVRAAGRILFTGTLQKNPLNAATPPPTNFIGDNATFTTYTPPRSRRFDHEFGIQIDSYLNLGHGHAATGSLVWSRRTVTDGHYADRVFYFYRGPEVVLRDSNIRLTTDVGFGAQHDDGWHLGATRLIGVLAIDLPELSGIRTGSVDVAFGPTYIPGPATQRHTYREAAVYYHTTLFARLAPRSR